MEWKWVVPVTMIAGGCLTCARYQGSDLAPDWMINRAIYEVNIRQYSPGGTFREFETHLPRLQEMGVGIIWLMPIHPIGEQNRKGTLGSYYAVKDYRAVNPEFGTMEDFRCLVRHIHELGMIVILDWVANHTAWDNPLAHDHPEWFMRDSLGRFVPPVADWHDVIDLDYSQPGLRRYMTDALKFWITETGVDGFRCDVAEMVPMDFWQSAITELRQLKPIFMLAEGDAPQLYAAGFDMTYDWKLYYSMNEIAAGLKTPAVIDTHLRRVSSMYTSNALRMLFTTNHDENSWNGTARQRLGDALTTFTVLTLTLDGMPLIYSGQEAGLDKSLRFFDKDTIEWRADPLEHIFNTLLNFRRTHPVLWPGEKGGQMRKLNSHRLPVYAFTRSAGLEKVLVILNLSAGNVTYRPDDPELTGSYVDLFNPSESTINPAWTIDLEPWAYRVFYSSKPKR